MLALCAFGPAGCLVADAPDYGPARQTAPVFVLSSIKPEPLYQFELEVSRDVQLVSMVATSEDAGQELTAVLYVDYRTPDPRETYIREYDIAPMPFDQPKAVSFEFAPLRGQVSPGCHTLSVLLMHESSWDGRKREVTDFSDVDVVTWFFVATDITNPGVSVPCPNGPPPDAGVE